MLQSTMRVGVVGLGSIGHPVAQAIHNGAVQGASLEAVVDVAEPDFAQAQHVSLDDAIERCDLLIECSGPAMLAEHGSRILDAGTDLLICSVGALADVKLEQRLLSNPHSRLFVTTGAIGGLDILTAAASVGEFSSLTLTTTKKPAPLVQEWMNEDEADRIRKTSETLEIFAGNARDAVRKFPGSLNVAASISIAVRDWDILHVSLNADPAATLTTHVIEATGKAGTYRFENCNYASQVNPRTSGVVPFSVLQSLRNVVGSSGNIL